MRPFSPESLLLALRSFGVPDGACLCLAFSGGLDSTVLLHALARLLRERPQCFALRLVHIDHQLQASSDRWRAHCEAAARDLSVPFTAMSVQVDASDGGLEAAARRARYDALREQMQADEVVLTAHHADDQLETVLLALMRGAGVTGLSGIVGDQRFGCGRLVRPLLGFDRRALEAWARAEHLDWIEDPSNENTELDRNFLRRRVTPVLRERWPAVAHNASRAAAHLNEAHEILASIARADLEHIEVEGRLSAAHLLALDAGRRRNVLRYWIRQRGARAPSTRKLAALDRDLLTAAPDRTPCVAWDDVEVRRYRGLLYLDRRLSRHDGAELRWDTRVPLELPAALGRIQLRPDASGRLSATKLAPTLLVRFRAGGEKLRIAGESHRRSLKKMLQAAGVPPWRRDRVPLIYSDDRLAAVGDLWVADEFAARDGEDAMSLVWTKGAVD